MIELVFNACFAVSCAEQRLTFAESPGTLSAIQCALNGQIEIAKWSAAHPGWRIMGGYKCRPAGVIAKV